MDEKKENIIDQLFTGREDLPTLPTLFGEFIVLMNTPSVSPRKVAELIKKDQGMVAKIVKFSNIVLYGKREEIRDITSAVTYLGLNRLKRIVLEISLTRMFTFGPSHIPDFDPVSFWEHSLGTAFFSELLAKSLNFTQYEDFYLAGLMHDVGKKMLYHCYPDHFEEIVFNQINEGIPGYQAEKEVLGVDHTDIGVFFADKWRFNRTIVDAIRNHHTPGESESKEVTLVVYLANLFAKTADLCFPWEDRAIDIARLPVWDKVLAISQADVDPDKLTLQLVDATPQIKLTVTSLLGEK
jgi:putative nucleotidyltransferase with HDIG domain